MLVVAKRCCQVSMSGQFPSLPAAPPAAASMLLDTNVAF
jgi:hypothetical protein